MAPPKKSFKKDPSKAGNSSSSLKYGKKTFYDFLH